MDETLNEIQSKTCPSDCAVIGGAAGGIAGSFGGSWVGTSFVDMIYGY